MSEPTTTNLFGAFDRLYTNKSPQYKCASSTYGYTVAKGDLTYPIGLLTVDEAAYAGGVYTQTNTSYYLYTGETYWTMSPRAFDSNYANVFDVLSHTGAWDYYRVIRGYATVPALSLKAEATIKRGTGVYNDPYIILTN